MPGGIFGAPAKSHAARESATGTSALRRGLPCVLSWLTKKLVQGGKITATRRKHQNFQTAAKHARQGSEMSGVGDFANSDMAPLHQKKLNPVLRRCVSSQVEHPRTIRTEKHRTTWLRCKEKEAAIHHSKRRRPDQRVMGPPFTAKRRQPGRRQRRRQQQRQQPPPPPRRRLPKPQRSSWAKKRPP